LRRYPTSGTTRTSPSAY